MTRRKIVTRLQNFLRGHITSHTNRFRLLKSGGLFVLLPLLVLFACGDDDTPGPGPGISMSALTISASTMTAIAENGGVAAFTVVASPAPSEEITVNLTRSGTATPGDDYSPSAGLAGADPNYTLTVGTSGRAVFTVRARVDSAMDDDETIIFTLAEGGYMLSGSTTAMVSINDVPPGTPIPMTPTVTISASGMTVSEDRGLVVFTVVASPAPSRDLRVNLVRSGTATLVDDYSQTAELSGTDPNYMLTIGTTAAVAAFAVTGILDGITDEDETIIFTLAAGAGYTLTTVMAETMAMVSINDVLDTDLDGIADTVDPDDDNDGIPDSQEAEGQQLIPDCGGTPTTTTRVQDGTQANPYCVDTLTELQSIASGFQNSYRAQRIEGALPAAESLSGHYRLTANIDAWPTNEATPSSAPARPSMITYADGTVATDADGNTAMPGTTTVQATPWASPLSATAVVLPRVPLSNVVRQEILPLTGQSRRRGVHHPRPTHHRLCYSHRQPRN